MPQKRYKKKPLTKRQKAEKVAFAKRALEWAVETIYKEAPHEIYFRHDGTNTYAFDYVGSLLPCAIEHLTPVSHVYEMTGDGGVKVEVQAYFEGDLSPLLSSDEEHRFFPTVYPRPDETERTFAARCVQTAQTIERNACIAYVYGVLASSRRRG